MPVRRPLCFAVAAALCFWTALTAEEGGLTLDKAVETALARNPEVLAAAARLDAARGRTLQLKARPVPELAAGIEGIPLPGLRNEGDEVEVRLGLEQTFESPGKRGLRTEIGRRGEDMAAAELDRVRLLITAGVKKAYWSAAFAGRAVAALERSVAQIDALLEDLQARYRTGAADYADVLRVRAEKARLRNQILEQARDGRAAELALAGLLGDPSGAAAVPSDELPFVPLAADAAELVERALATRPSARLAALGAERAGAAVRLAGLERRPDLVAGLMLPSLRPNAWGVSFGLTLPFLRPGRARGAEMEAAAEAEAARFVAAAAGTRLRAAVESAVAAAKSAEAQVLVYESGLLRELEDELGIQLEYFRYGKVGAFALLDLHRAYVLARVERLRALLLYNLALADLEVAGETAD
jgi:cobalt-zinc-cadmium efflux system outer membrane protein